MNHGTKGEDASNAPSPALLERLIAPLSRLGAGIAAIGVLVVLAITGYSVFNRYVLGTPVTWTDELSGFLVVGIVMFGAAETLRRGEHISVDLMTSRLRGGAQLVAGIWGTIAVVLVMTAIMISGITAVSFSYDFGIYSEGYLALPMWIPQLALIIGGVMVIAVAVGRFCSILSNRSTGR